MAWNMSFEYDAQNDVVTAYFTDCVLVNEEDVLRWRREVEVHLSRYAGSGKVDLLINLDGLVVKFTAGRVFGKERREVLERFTHRSYRFGGDDMTQMFVLTSGAINGAAVNHYATRDEALAALKAEREALRQRGPSPFGGGFAGSKA
ncbi:hypothetical protein HUA74_21120 [Myxococcus sp. CA051A]|uniref:Uncharacterized protein n=1 Tax=Myxococcus llanfairpwllgwyngyllgogerychwyrndrobwllllantysiliogogogochensis TaxID=2590453 RepID=A0A540WQG8_9BACT|nr:MULTISPECIES: hypothetical protein [Myxococcus]NTX10362.1 hypothetical protein [Myxococcus sp. CA056]NTX37429.1 hypothetical protein [Myxococcus sp. CA033]NTX50209.1 hypothetical protein [Myxococcus sp. CA039A]NTX63155.1 hypothetical protein [Myxococcus sp. CA051A]TQF11261.1 hypothetical protein FJV41_35215 [Myxococcus llanfairpwllgwyngyllgogerychwyrndrobwllllantysiliogogogochensis]